MKEIIFTTGCMTRGGAERVISIIANALVNKGYKVSIIMMLFSECTCDLDPKIEVIDISNSSKKQAFDALRIIRRTRAIIKQRKPIVVISFMVMINILTWFACYGLKQKLIVSERNDPSLGRGKLVKFVQKRVYASATISVFQTNRARNYFSNKVQAKSVVIPNPISVNCYAKTEKESRIVTVGRLTEQKNQKVLINAFNRIHDFYPEYSLTIYGEGNLRKQLEEQINALGLSSSVFLPGNTSTIHEEISNATMFVLSSNYEGQSNALLEAMMMGLPCISTNCAGSDEAIINNRNGLLVNIGDENGLFNAMKYIIDHKNESDFIAQTGQDYAKKKYSPSIIIDRWEEIINRIQ